MTDQPDQPANAVKSMDDIMALCKRRGFIYQASEIYGGINGFWDYGPLGAQLKKNLRDAWWQDVVMNPCQGKPGPDGNPVEIVPVDTCIIQNPKVWEASGHVGGFNDPMVDCKQCKSRFRADHLWVVPLAKFSCNDGMSLEEFSYYINEMDTALDPQQKAELQRIFLSKIQIETRPLLVKTVIETSEHGARIAAELSKRERKEYGSTVQEPIIPINSPCLIADIPHGWPSPPCPNCGMINSLTEPRAFNLMFKTFVGATSAQTDENAAYLRPETAQGIFVQFRNVVDTTRVAVPFGIAQTGKAFRNEVTPRNFTFRSREFEQMEIEFFCHESEAVAWYRFWRDWRMQWWQSLGLAGDNLQLREHDRDELAHYAKTGAGTSDIEYRFPFTAPGFGELEGVAHRGDFDLTQHEKHSGKKMQYFDTTRGEIAPNGQPKGQWYTPHVIEPSAGLDRGVLAILCEAYTPDPGRPSGVVMKFHPRIAPIKAAVFPLVNKDGMPEKAQELRGELVRRFGHLGAIEYDAKQSIGKRYARMDEAGCPFCFTIDGDTLTDGTVTVRDRDTAEQHRIPQSGVVDFLAARLGM